MLLHVVFIVLVVLVVAAVNEGRWLTRPMEPNKQWNRKVQQEETGVMEIPFGFFLHGPEKSFRRWLSCISPLECARPRNQQK